MPFFGAGGNTKLKTHFIVRIGFCTTLCVLSIDRQREMNVFFLNFVIFLTQRARLHILKIRVYLCKKNLIDEISLSDCITL